LAQQKRKADDGEKSFKRQVEKIHHQNLAL
jgi:hypothetical protein